MLKIYLKIAWRNLIKDRQFALLNIIGLSAGLACTLLIYLWVSDEWSFDKFHEKESQLYQLMENRKFPDHVEISDESNGILGETLAKQTPEIEYYAAVAPAAWFQKFTLSVGDKSLKAVGQYVGKDYLNIFSFPLAQGNKNEVLQDKNAIVISENLAIKFFNSTDNVIGKTIRFKNEKDFTVSGIFKKIPAHSSEQFDFLLSFDFYKDNEKWVNNWQFPGTGPHNFVILRKGTDINAFNKKISSVIAQNGGENFRTVFALPFSENYLHNSFVHGVRVGGKILYVKIFSLIAVFILAIACINFMNLSTAKATRRLKEVGIKKVVGASRRELVIQFLGESIILSFIAVAIALAIVALLLPQFNQLTGKEMILSFNSRLLLSILAIALVTGFIAGSYPALYLSGFKPITILKGRFPTSLRELVARKGLVVFQFALSVSLIIAVFVIYQQMKYIQDKNPGFNKENIIRFDSEGKILNNQEKFIALLKTIPGVLNASGTSHNIIGRVYGIYEVKWPGKSVDDKSYFEVMSSGYDFIDLMGMKMASGRNFSRNFGAEDSKIILNQAAVAAIGLKDPVGKTIKVYNRDREIIGVVKDFNFESLHETVKPLIIPLVSQDGSNWYKILVKLKAGEQKETIDRIRELYNSYNPGVPFEYNYLDQSYQQQYQAEYRVGVLSRYFAALAIIISCLGLFGLVAFTAQMRRRK